MLTKVKSELNKFLPNLKDKLAKEKFSFGLDIGTQSIKAVRLKYVKNTVELCGFNLEVIQSDSSEVLKRIKESYGLQSVNIAASGPSTVIRYVNFPKMNREELKRALKFEAQKHIPFAMAEINLDGYILKEDPLNNEIFVLIAAVKKDLISQRLKLIEDAGLKANIIDIDSTALVNAFNFNYSQEDFGKHKAVALLNIGASLSNLNILENGLPRLSRDIHIAGNSFTQKLMDTFGVDFKSAESQKLNPDSQRSNEMAVALESILTNLASEIRISFDYFESQSSSSATAIFLSGGGSKFTGLKDMLADLLGIEVQYWDPLKKINLSSGVDSEKLKALSSDLAVAVGLALRS